MNEPSRAVASKTAGLKEDSPTRMASPDGLEEPAFLEDDTAVQDVPTHVHTANASSLFGIRPGETVAEAAARKASER